MEDTIYRRWWQLHLRVAKGERLDPTEQKEYDAGLEAFDREEKGQFQPNGLAMLRRLRAQVAQRQETHARLLAQSHQLDQQILALENAYHAMTGYELAVETDASS